MFDSGKQNGFKALIYMHRYDENMVAKVRADYLHVLQRKYESEINRLDNDINSEILSTKEKTVAKKRKEKIQKQLAECKQYDQVIAHVAHQRIAIDLDDGVKVNYQKFQGVEVPQGDGKKDLKQDLLFKVKMQNLNNYLESNRINNKNYITMDIWLCLQLYLKILYNLH